MVLHASPAAMGILAALGGASVLLFGLIAGVWVDRLPHRPILIASDLGRAALLATIPLAAAAHVLGLPQLYAVAALSSVLTVFFDVAYQSCLPALVEREQIFEANSKLTTTSTAAEIVGPGLTGLLVQLVTAPFAIALDAASFVFSALCVLAIRRPDPPATAHAEQHPWRDGVAGFHFLAANPALRALGIRSAIAWFFFGFLGPLYILYCIQILGLTPVELGLTIAMGGVGGILGSLLAGRLTDRLGLGPTFLAMAIGHGLTALLIPLAHGTPVMAMAYLMGSQLFGDFCFTVYFINEMSLRQTVVPADRLGRVNAAMQLASRGMVPLGSLVGGFLAAQIGVRMVLAIGIGGVLFSTLWLFGPPVRELRR
jgi:MFS family permease